VLGRGIQHAVSLGAEPSQIEAHARAYRHEFEARHEPSATELGTVLYRELIQPVEHWLPKGATLVIAPDRALHQVPFAALQKTSRDEYLVQEHPLVFAASARLFFRASASQSQFDAPPTLLVIANPSADPLTSLPPLPGAEREATDIAALYPGAVKLLRNEATRHKFMDLAPEASVVHIAAHASANEEFPDLSRLFLAPESGASGVVTVNDLRRLKFQRTKLVVLAACDTASGATFRGEGVTSLARPFLAGGVPQVVSTLWQVDDQTSRRLFTEFHHGYALGLSAAKALQQAQIAVMFDKTLPHSSWAATVLLGSVESLTESRSRANPSGGDISTRNRGR
jgi:CHAT domain-containing protein